MNRQTQTIVKDLRSRFESLYGPRLVNMVLYGSHAQGDAVPGSDIDVLVVLEGPVDPGGEIARTGKITADLSLEHDAVISCVFMDEDRFTTRNGPFLRNVRRKGIVL